MKIYEDCELIVTRDSEQKGNALFSSGSETADYLIRISHQEVFELLVTKSETISDLVLIIRPEGQVRIDILRNTKMVFTIHWPER